MFLVGTILLAMFMFTGCGSTTVDLNKYMTIEVTGYDSRELQNILLTVNLSSKTIPTK